MYKIAICDDDKRYRKTIREIVEHENSLHENEIRFYEYESGNELLKHTDILHELVFIDIRMPGLDGNQTALKLRNYNKDAVLIFYSSYFEPTVDSINFGQPFRYIMKDLHDTSLRFCGPFCGLFGKPHSAALIGVFVGSRAIVWQA